MLNNGYKINILLLVSILSVTAGILVITNKNPVRSVLFLIGLFLTVAAYLFILDIAFIALAYLLVYVGAVSILFLFILMLINIRVSELTTDNSNSIPLSIITLTTFSVIFSSSLEYLKPIVIQPIENAKKILYDEKSYLNSFIKALENKETNLNINDNIIGEMSIYTDLSPNIFTNLKEVWSGFLKEGDDKISLAFSCMWDGLLWEASHILSIGNVIYTFYSVGILVVGLILLLSMVGAISITAKSSYED